MKLYIDPEHANAVQDALYCSTCDDKQYVWKDRPWTEWSHDVGHKACPDCPPSFWLGVKAEWPMSPLGPTPELPADVQAMLDPCQTCKGTGMKTMESPPWTSKDYDPCPEPNCIKGWQLVELVTDCSNKQACAAGDDTIRCVCTTLDGTVSLGFVTAHPKISPATFVFVRSDGTEAPGRFDYIGPSDANVIVTLTKFIK